MTCETAKQDFIFYLYGELDFNQEEELEGHVAECGSCRQELDRARVFHAAVDRSEIEPSPELLLACRREMRSRVASAKEASRNTFAAHVVRFFTVTLPSAAFLRPAGAVALIILGFAGGRLWDVTSRATEPSMLRVRDLNANSQGGVDLVLEEVREKRISGRLDDDRIHRMLLAAATDPSDPGLRVRTLDLLKDRYEQTDVRRALLQALQGDTNPGVRLKAIEALRPISRDPDTRKVLSQVLLMDDNPGVRTQAIDMLLQDMHGEVIGTLQELILRENNPYIRQKSFQALREANASVETF